MNKLDDPLFASTHYNHKVNQMSSNCSLFAVSGKFWCPSKSIAVDQLVYVDHHQSMLNYLKFQQQKSLKNQYLPHSESKSYKINSIKSCSSRSFQQHQSHIPIQINLLFSEEIIQYSRNFTSEVQTSWNQANAPLLIESFPKTPRTQSEASRFSGSHNQKTKQNKLPSCIDR